MLAMREVRAIYHHGVYAVADTIRQLYEMIEVEDERVHRPVAAATAAHLRKIEQLTARIARLEAELAYNVREVHQLNPLIAKEAYEAGAAHGRRLMRRIYERLRSRGYKPPAI